MKTPAGNNVVRLFAGARPRSDAVAADIVCDRGRSRLSGLDATSGRPSAAPCENRDVRPLGERLLRTCARLAAAALSPGPHLRPAAATRTAAHLRAPGWIMDVAGIT